jgi:hypothetical protein
MYSAKAIADDAVGTIVGATILGAGGAVASTLGGSSVTDMVLAGVGLFALALLVFVAKAARAHRDGVYSEVPVEQRGKNGDTLRLVGRPDDQRAVLLLDERVVEFDASGYEYFAGRVDPERLQIARAVAAGKLSRFSAFMLRAIVEGDALTDEEIYEERARGKGTRFWTRSEIRENEAAAKGRPEVWSWYNT